MVTRRRERKMAKLDGGVRKRKEVEEEEGSERRDILPGHTP